MGLGILNNERGSIIVVALLMIMLLTITIVGGSRISGTEIKIASNKKTNDRSFYLAEGLISHAVATLESTTPMVLSDSTRKTWPTLLVDKVTDTAGVVYPGIGGWTGGETYDWVAPAASQTWPNTTAWQDGNPRAATDVFDYLLVHQGVDPKSGLGLDGSRVYQYNVRSRVRSGNGETEISIGYRKRF